MPKKPRVELKCPNCKKMFEVLKSQAYKRKFCGHKCSTSGKFNSNYGKHPVAWNKGIPHSLETRRKLSIAAKNRIMPTGEKARNWKRGYWKTAMGYIGMMHNGKRMFQHKVFWERVNGKVPEGYVIHHKNGIKDDNRIENLEIMSHSKHSSMHHIGNKYWLGKKHSDETRKKMSESAKIRYKINKVDNS